VISLGAFLWTAGFFEIGLTEVGRLVTLVLRILIRLSLTSTVSLRNAHFRHRRLVDPDIHFRLVLTFPFGLFLEERLTLIFVEAPKPVLDLFLPSSKCLWLEAVEAEEWDHTANEDEEKEGRHGDPGKTIQV